MSVAGVRTATDNRPRDTDAADRARNNYYVPYQEDLNAALQQLRREVFEAGDYYWVNGGDWRPVEEREPRPQSLEELWEDELVQEAGTHSILDVFRVVGPDDTPDCNTVDPVTADEARALLGTDKLTRAHVEDFDVFPRSRWIGRCAVLHDDAGHRRWPDVGHQPLSLPTWNLVRAKMIKRSSVMTGMAHSG